MKAANLFYYFIAGFGPALGIPIGVTWLLSGVLSAWTPLSLLALLGVIVLWIVGLVWLAASTYAFFAPE